MTLADRFMMWWLKRSNMLKLIKAELEMAKQNSAQMMGNKNEEALAAYWQGRWDGLSKVGFELGLINELPWESERGENKR